MIRIAICDDEIKCCEQMKSYLLQYMKMIQKNLVIDVYQAGEDLLNADIIYDIIFLDIELKVVDGITIGKKIKDINISSLIVYVTSHKKYYANAFQIHAFMYLTKPCKYEEVYNVMNDCLKYIEKNQKNKYMMINVNGNIINFSIDDVYYFEYIERKVVVHAKVIKPSICISMKQLYEQIAKYGFGIPHSAFIINYKYVSKILGYNLILKNEDIIPISQRKMKQFKKELADYLQKTYYIIQ